MQQTNLWAFACYTAPTAHATEEARHAKRVAEAARLGLEWPLKSRAPGRPSRATLFREAVGQALCENRFDEVVALASLEPHAAWQPGGPLLVTEAVASEYAKSIGAHVKPVAAPAMPTGRAPEADVPGESRKKRRKAADVPQRVRDAFLSWAKHQENRHKWPMTKCLRVAAEVAPEVFGELHPDTPRKWKMSSGAEESASKRGRKGKLTPGHLVELSAITHTLVGNGVPFSADIFQQLANRVMSPSTVSLRWCQRFLNSEGLSFKSICRVRERAKFTEPEVLRAQHMLKLKLWWLLRHHNVDPQCVYNLDESGVSLLSVPDKSWATRGKVDVAYPTDKAQCTFTLAVPICTAASPSPFPLLGQLVFKGLTTRSLPEGPYPEHVSVTHSPTHWANTDTICQFLQHIQTAVGPDTPWVCLWDCATVHTSAETRARIAADFPQCHLCYIAGGTTAFNQPCDRSLFRPLKAHMRKEFCKAAATSVMNGLDGMGSLTKAPLLKVDLPALASHGMRSLTAADKVNSWKHLVLGEHESRDEILAQADLQHARGALFGSHRSEDTVQNVEDEDGHPEDDDIEDVGDDESQEDEELEPPGPDPEQAAQEELPQQSKGISKFLALRLLYGRPSKADLASAGAVPSTA